MKDTYWLEKRIEGLENHIEELYKIIDQWKQIVDDKDDRMEKLSKSYQEIINKSIKNK